MRAIPSFTLLAVFALAGCSSNNRTGGQTAPSSADALTEVGGMVRSYASETGKGPAKQADLAKYQNEFPHGWAALKSGEVVVVWGAKVAGEGGEGGGTGVVAYLKTVPETGGAVFLENGQVKEMSAEEFKSAPKAK